MKRLGIFALAAMLFVGLSACEQKADEKEGEGGEGGQANVENATGSDQGNPAASTQPNTPAPNQAQPASNLPLTTVEWYEDNYNFGEVPEGDKVRHTFKFRNSGSNPLKIENVKPSCGCTTPEYSKDEVAPGAEGFIVVEFDSKNKPGMNKKSLNVFANTDPANKLLTFTAEVVPR